MDWTPAWLFAISGVSMINSRDDSISMLISDLRIQKPMGTCQFCIHDTQLLALMGPFGKWTGVPNGMNPAHFEDKFYPR